MAAGGTAGNVDLGPGRLWVAPLGTTEPTSASTALDAAFWAIGYTEDGTEIQTNITNEAVTVAEELDPVSNEITGRETQLAVQMAEMTRKRLYLALGGGAGLVDNANPLTPPAPAAVVPVILVWDSEETATGNNQNRRYIFHSCTPSGTITTARRKAPQKALLSVTFKCAITTAAGAPFTVRPNASGQV